MSANGQGLNGHGGAPSKPVGPVLKAAEASSWIDGFAFRDRARREAEALVADMQAAYERRKQEGFEQGRREGAALAAERLAETNARIERYLAGIEGELVDLTLGVVRRLVGTMETGELIGRLAREAIERFRRDQALTVTVAPENLELARSWLRAHDDATRQVTVEADARLGPLDCRVESPYATVDAGLDAQLETVRRELKEPSGGHR